MTQPTTNHKSLFPSANEKSKGENERMDLKKDTKPSLGHSISQPATPLGSSVPLSNRYEEIEKENTALRKDAEPNLNNHTSQTPSHHKSTFSSPHGRGKIQKIHSGNDGELNSSQHMPQTQTRNNFILPLSLGDGKKEKKENSDVGKDAELSFSHQTSQVQTVHSSVRPSSNGYREIQKENTNSKKNVESSLSHYTSEVSTPNSSKIPLSHGEREEERADLGKDAVPNLSHYTSREASAYASIIPLSNGDRKKQEEKVDLEKDTGLNLGHRVSPTPSTLSSMTRPTKVSSSTLGAGSTCSTINVESASSQLALNLPQKDDSDLTVELHGSKVAKKFDKASLNAIWDAHFEGSTLWICGWSRNIFSTNDTVLLRVKDPTFESTFKKKKEDGFAHIATMMIPYQKDILLAQKGGKQILSFDIKERKFKTVHSSADLHIASMCCSNTNLYILDRINPAFIRVLDSSFYSTGHIPSFIDDAQQSDMDMCLIPGTSSANQAPGEVNDTIVISREAPHGSVRAVNRKNGVIWKLDSSTKQLGSKFNPCSVSASAAGDIFVLDKSTAMVYLLSPDKTSARVVLSGVDGIKKPIRARVDKELTRLMVIHEGGKEIMNYKIKTTVLPSAEKRSSILEETQSPTSKVTGTDVSNVADNCHRQKPDQDPNFGLTDAKLHELSERFTSKDNLRDLSFRGLGIGDHKVEKQLQNSDTTTAAAYQLFKEWRDTQPNAKVALDRMKKALANTNRPFLIQIFEQ